MSAQKALRGVRDGDEGVAGRNGGEQCFPDKGSLICPPGKSIFHKKETEKIELVARPGCRKWRRRCLTMFWRTLVMKSQTEHLMGTLKTECLGMESIWSGEKVSLHLGPVAVSRTPLGIEFFGRTMKLSRSGLDLAGTIGIIL